MIAALLSALGFLGQWWDWIAGGIGLASAAGGALLPRWWRAAAIGVLVLVVAGYVGVQKIRSADLRADLAQRSAELVTATLERDQAAVAAEANARSLADLKRRHAAELAALDRRRQALESALSQRDQVLEEVRREKSARDPLPGAFDQLLDGVQ